MHEMGIALEIINIATASIPIHLKNSKIKKVNVKIGQLSTVIPETLKFCFNIVSKNTLLNNAKLSIEILPLKLKCKKCDQEFVTDKPNFVCNICNSGRVIIISGRELDIKSIEIEKDK